MKKIITIALLLIALTSQAQISDELTQDTIDLWIVPGCTKCITAAKMLSILTHLNDNKLHKDSLDIYAASIGDTSLWSRNTSSGQAWNKNLTDDVGIGTQTPATKLDVAGTTTTDELIMESPYSWMDGFRKQPYYMNDLLSNNYFPWYNTAISSGTLALGVATANHPGVLIFTSSTSTNSGYMLQTYADQVFLIGGGEMYSCIFNPALLAGTTIRLGFHDATTVTAPTDGVYLEVAADSTLRGKTANNTTRSTTGTGYKLSLNTWYRAKLLVNADATRIDYYLYNDAGTELWTDYLTANIPTARNTACITIATNSGTSALSLMSVDYIAIMLGTLIR